MKHFYSITLLVLSLFIGTSCKDDYREMVFFSGGGVPIYDIGTCNNLISSINMYTITPETTAVGIDGGDGNYTVLNANEAVITAEITSLNNGYHRLRLTRKALGEALITVNDGSGKSAVLKVVVSEFKYTWAVSNVGIIIRGTVSDVEKTAIEAAFKGTYPVPEGGRYDFYPDLWTNWSAGGRLKVYLNDTAVSPLVGRYESKPMTFEGKQVLGHYFTYNDKEYVYFNLSALGKTRETGPVSTYLVEEVTAICPVDLPEGVTVFRAQRVQYSTPL